MPNNKCRHKIIEKLVGYTNRELKGQYFFPRKLSITEILDFFRLYSIFGKILDSLLRKDLYYACFQLQADLVICGLFIGDFVCVRLKIGLFKGTYSLNYRCYWSLNVRT